MAIQPRFWVAELPTLTPPQIDEPATNPTRLISLACCQVPFQTTIALEVLLQGFVSEMFLTIRGLALTAQFVSKSGTTTIRRPFQA
jgi:hypothetical protein